MDVVRRRVRELRLDRGWTQAQLCERAGISVDAITRIEGGKREPGLKTIEQLAAALGVPASAFFEGAAPPPEGKPSARMRRVVALLETQPADVLALAEGVVTGLVRARQRAIGGRDGGSDATAKQDRRKGARRQG